MIDWGKVKEENKYKNYAKPGIYNVKCIDVDIHEVGSNGSIVQEFIFEETDDTQYPKATHWLTFKEDKTSWRQWHNRQLMIVLGSSEDTAEKAVEKAESAGSKEKIAKTYEAIYKNLLNKKKPMVEIEVFMKGKYTNAEFTDRRVALPHNDDTPKAEVNEYVPEDITEEAVDDGSIDLSELPF